MIRKGNKALRPRLLAFLDRDAFGVKIAGDVLAYGLAQPFAEFWLQLNEKNEITAAVGRLDEALTVCARAPGEEAGEELRAFCAMLPGVRQATGSPDALSGFEALSEGDVMTLSGPLKEPSPGEARGDISAQEIVTLLYACEGESITLPERDALYVDLSHRLRHGVARSRGLYEGGRLVSVALTTSETERKAIMGGVATHPAVRREGCSTRVLASLCGELRREGKAVSLFCAGPENRSFYEKRGFRAVYRWMTAALNA